MDLRYSGVSGIGTVTAIRGAAEWFGAVELPVDFAVDDVSTGLLDELRKISEEEKALFSVHAPFRDLNIASRNDDIQRVAADHMYRALDVAVEIKARLLNLHPGIHGYFPESEYPEMKRREVQLFRELCRRADPHGLDIAVENLIKTNVHFEDTWTMDGILDLLRQVEAGNFGVCLDTGHAHQAGLAVEAAIERLDEFTRSSGRERPTLLQLHVHDNHGGPIDEHLPAGQGTIAWPAVMEALQANEFDGWIVFENMGLEKQKAAYEYWHQVLQQK
jgi:sugar phosphate isomerase/epimerase